MIADENWGTVGATQYNAVWIHLNFISAGGGKKHWKSNDIIIVEGFTVAWIYKGEGVKTKQKKAPNKNETQSNPFGVQKVKFSLVIVQHAQNVCLSVMILLKIVDNSFDHQRIESIGSYEELNGLVVFDLRL